MLILYLSAIALVIFGAFSSNSCPSPFSLKSILSFLPYISFERFFTGHFLGSLALNLSRALLFFFLL